MEGAAKCFSLLDVQRAGFIEKYDTRAGKIIDSGLPTKNYITIDTYANIFSDEPDAGRMILPATAKVMRGGRNPSNESEIPLDASCRRSQDQRLRRTATDRFRLHRNSDFKSNSKTIAEENLQS
ncbi:hypothetical protein E4U13_006724 [Claviceps humidiphila]|uniref:Uncharacterized protein n=1 Tax=Claviceps humidiphila TaxID=1294629 RepID=A0A9P7PUJ1_9HYPO|nr:hypothetical protein E4U13_006724 [Claviceps humidiphila]